MPCYKPLKGYRSCQASSSGKFGISFVPQFRGQVPLAIPCGQCIGCRIERSRQWAIRCMHEASLHERNCFVTLTFDDDHFPDMGSLSKDSLQRFFKRLRKRYGQGIRYYACGEYGESLGRPHYHACIFNHDFVDKQVWSVRSGVKLYTSDALSDLWPFGFSTVGDVTFESAAYVARYVLKKFSGDKAQDHYTRLVPETGELVEVAPEFCVMSRRPGIGRRWLDMYMTDVFPSDFVLYKGSKLKVPRYYDNIFERSSVFEHFALKMRRIENTKLYKEDNTPERLKVREIVTRSRLSVLKRSLDNES